MNGFEITFPHLPDSAVVIIIGLGLKEFPGSELGLVCYLCLIKTGLVESSGLLNFSELTYHAHVYVHTYTSSAQTEIGLNSAGRV